MLNTPCRSHALLGMGGGGGYPCQYTNTPGESLSYCRRAHQAISTKRKKKTGRKRSGLEDHGYFSVGRDFGMEKA